MKWLKQTNNNLRERSPIHVGASHIEMLSVNYPEFAVKNPGAQKSREIQASHFGCLPLNQNLGIDVRLILRRGILGYFDFHVSSETRMKKSLKHIFTL